ncbi:carbohydrate ABC transporter permease [Candidatus Gracilibacteria bacterium]|nr:carbohydrate ABC transporter permease [Candidatus Gracilibacteria bacterium]
MVDEASQSHTAPPTRRHGRLYRINNDDWFSSTLRISILLLFAVFFGLPLLWLLLVPTKNDAQLSELAPLAFGSFARVGEAWQNLLGFGENSVARWAWNSIVYTVGSLILGLAVTLPAGYGLAVAHFAGRRLLIWLTLITMIIPGSALVLPLFLELSYLRLANTPWAVILPAAFFPFGVYLAYIYYATSLPKDLIAAARVDGCNEWGVFYYIGLPLSRTLLGLLTFLSFTANWNNYFLPYVMLNTSTLFNLPVGLQVLMTGTAALRPTFATDLPIYRAEVALAGLMLVVPIALVFLFSQRFVISGALTGATKE